MSEARPPGGRRRALVRDVNPHLICVLCSGYFIEATTIVECLHTFCRSCLVKYLENNKFCPKCDVQLHKNNPLLSVRCDPILQQLVYKLVPGLYSSEMARRRKYYSELGGPTSDPDCGVFPIGDQYFSPDDSISLSLEFINGIKDEESSGDGEETLQDKQSGVCTVHHRRYLQCPAAVTMSHLKKFLRMKYCLSPDHKVDIIYSGEVLADDFSLMDVAYTFSWNKTTPMRFKFRLLQRYTVPVPEPPPEQDVDTKEPLTSLATLPQADPELGPAKEIAPKIQLKTLTVQVQKLSNKFHESFINKSEAKPNKPPADSATNNITSNVFSNNINNNNINDSYSGGKLKPLARHKAGPKSRTDSKTKLEIKSIIKTNPDRVGVQLKRTHHAVDIYDEDPLKLHEDLSEPEKKKSKFNNNNVHVAEEESYKMSPHDLLYDEPLEERMRRMEEEEKILKKEEDEKRRKRDEEERKRKREDEERRKRQEEADRRKKREEEERKRKRDEEERKRKREEKLLAEQKKDNDEDIYAIGKWLMDSKKTEEKMDVDKKSCEEIRIVDKPKEVLVEDKKVSLDILKKKEDKIKDKVEDGKHGEEKKFDVKPAINGGTEDKKKISKDMSYLEKLQDEDEDENRLKIMTPPVEEMCVDEKEAEKALSPLIAEVQPMMRSEERRKEKKKSKKAKHHHHHRHHDRKRDSPPALTKQHSCENDIIKLKIKLTEGNSKVPMYSVVDNNAENDRKEAKENGLSHKTIEKDKEKLKEKEKIAEKNKKEKEDDDEPQVVAEIVNKKSDVLRSDVETKEVIDRVASVESKASKDVPLLMKPLRPKLTTKVVNPKQIITIKQQQDIANVKPIMQSPPIKIQSPPAPRQSPSPKSVSTPKPVPTLKPSPPTTPKLNGTAEPLKMPPSTITVSKITAEEKRQMEQQKLLMSRNNNNGLDSKRPSLEIMLVNAPKKTEPTVTPAATPAVELKPVVKKVMRPTPPSIPLSRLGKGVPFGAAKGSPPPLVLANKATCHDESGALDLSGKSSRKSPDIDQIAMRNLMTLSDTAVQVRNGLTPDAPANATANGSQLKIPIPGLTKPVYQTQHQRTIKPGPNQTVRQIPNPSALMFRQHTINGRSLPPPGVPLSSLTKMESMTRNLEKVTACLTVKAAGEAAAYAAK